MFTHITIQGLGPYDSATLDLSRGRTTLVRGASESGKSTLVDAVCFALWGTDAAGKKFSTTKIRDGEPFAEVSLTTGKGMVFRRRIDRGRKTSRSLIEPGDLSEALRTQRFSTENDWRQRIAQLGNEDTLRLLLAPGSWIPLAQGAGGGRPLRDLLQQLLPITTPVHEHVAALLVEAGKEPRGERAHMTEAAAADERREAKRREAMLAGGVEALEANIIALEEAADEPLLDRAEIDRRHRLIAAHEKAIADGRAVERRAQEIAQAQQRQADWEARRAEIGEAPSAPQLDLEAVKRDRGALRRQLGEAREGLASREATLERLAPVIPELPEGWEWNDGKHGGVLRTYVASLSVASGRASVGVTLDVPGPDEEAASRGGWSPPTEVDQDIHVDALRYVLAQHAAAQSADKVEAAKVAVEEAAQRLQVAEQRVQDIEATVERTESEHEALSRHQAATRALGRKPEVPEPLEPVTPPSEHLTAEEVSEYHAAKSQRPRTHIDKTRDERDRVRAELDVQREAVEYFSALVEAIRQAPSRVLAEQLEALGDLGPVTLIPGEGTSSSPSLSVLIDGRDWGDASTGRQVVADAALRLALRAALGLRWWPVVIDNVTSVAGQEIPDAPGPVWRLVTVDVPAIETEVL